MKLFWTIGFLSILLFSLAQKPKAAFFVELGGGGLATFNFDTRFHGNKGFGMRLGLQAGLITIDGKSIIIIPLEINYITNKTGNHFFELGLGTTFYNGNKGELKASYGFLDIGYRYAPSNGGLFFRATLTPVISLTDKAFYPLWGGISLGIALK